MNEEEKELEGALNNMYFGGAMHAIKMMEKCLNHGVSFEEAIDKVTKALTNMESNPSTPNNIDQH